MLAKQNFTGLKHTHLLCRDYGTTRGYPNESEYTYVKVDFYNNIAKYLSELSNTKIKSLADIVKYNIDNVGTEGGTPGISPAFGSGQDGFIASLETKGIMNSTYWEALSFCQRKLLSKRTRDTPRGACVDMSHISRR